MIKKKIEDLIEDKHTALFDFLEQHDDAKWPKGPANKWTSGQHIVHLIQGMKPLNKGLSIPKFMLHYKFGVANRKPRNYNEIVAKYHSKLAEIDGKIVSPFSQNMPETPESSKEKFIKELTSQKNILIKKLRNHSEAKLDKYLLPHPLMGRMLLREIIMWTAYHTEHHHHILRDKY